MGRADAYSAMYRLDSMLTYMQLHMYVSAPEQHLMNTKQLYTERKAQHPASTSACVFCMVAATGVCTCKACGCWLSILL